MSAVTDIQHQFKNGHLAVTPGLYVATAATLGTVRTVPPTETIAARVATGPAQDRPPGSTMPSSSVVQVGEAPDGFGKLVAWSDQDAELALVVFLNTADPLGVAIQGVKATDTMQLVSATGLASFGQDTEIKGWGALIGLVTSGVGLTAAAFGSNAAAPLISGGAAFAKDHLGEEKIGTLVRDPFGEDPKSHNKARQEGGVLVCAPAAQGIFSSGEDEKFWIRKPGDRTDENRPEHVAAGKSFFVRRGMEPRTFDDAGDVYVVAWDFDFPDNVGFYELHLILRRGNGVVTTTGSGGGVGGGGGGGDGRHSQF
jgi:hypothetical protein